MSARPSDSRRVAAYTVLLLFLSNVLNFADRALLGIVVDPVKADLRLSDTQMSLVSGSAFVLFNLAVGVFLARWVDRGDRKRILVLGVLVWSAATALTGLAQGFVSLGLTRVLVGVGEATALPVAVSMIADLFTPERRPRAFGVYQSSGFVGVVGGSIAAGVLAAAKGWRAMFLICGAAGLVLALFILLTMAEPPRGRQDGPAASGPADVDLGAAVAHLVRLPGFVVLTLGAGISAMAGGVLPVWAPTFLLRSHDVALAQVGALIGPTVGLGGVTGTIASGLLAARLVRRRGGEIHSLIVPMIALPLAIPFFAIFCFAPSLVATMAAATIMNFLLASGGTPCLAAAVGMAPPLMRAVASTFLFCVIGVLGGAVAPLVVGAASDLLAPRLGAESLRYALAGLVVTQALSPIILWLAWRLAAGGGTSLRRPRPAPLAGEA